jgi:hypothetical protein
MERGGSPHELEEMGTNVLPNQKQTPSLADLDHELHYGLERSFSLRFDHDIIKHYHSQKFFAVTTKPNVHSRVNYSNRCKTIPLFVRTHIHISLSEPVHSIHRSLMELGPIGLTRPFLVRHFIRKPRCQVAVTAIECLVEMNRRSRRSFLYK